MTSNEVPNLLCTFCSKCYPTDSSSFKFECLTFVTIDLTTVKCFKISVDLINEI